MEKFVGTLGIQIRTRRKRLGMKQSALAKAAGVSKDVIHNLENGVTQNTASGKVTRIAKILRCTAEDLQRVPDRDDGRSGYDALSTDLLRDLVANAAEQILIFVREEGLPDDPHSISQEIAAAFIQMEESARLRARAVVVNLGGKVVELRPWGKSA